MPTAKRAETQDRPTHGRPVSRYPSRQFPGALKAASGVWAVGEEHVMSGSRCSHFSVSRSPVASFSVSRSPVASASSVHAQWPSLSTDTVFQGRFPGGRILLRKAWPRSPGTRGCQGRLLPSHAAAADVPCRRLAKAAWAFSSRNGSRAGGGGHQEPARTCSSRSAPASAWCPRLRYGGGGGRRGGANPGHRPAPDRGRRRRPVLFGECSCKAMSTPLYRRPVHRTACPVRGAPLSRVPRRTWPRPP